MDTSLFPGSTPKLPRFGFCTRKLRSAIRPPLCWPMPGGVAGRDIVTDKAADPLSVYGGGGPSASLRKD